MKDRSNTIISRGSTSGLPAVRLAAIASLTCLIVSFFISLDNRHRHQSAGLPHQCNFVLQHASTKVWLACRSFVQAPDILHPVQRHAAGASGTQMQSLAEVHKLLSGVHWSC